MTEPPATRSLAEECGELGIPLDTVDREATLAIARAMVLELNRYSCLSHSTSREGDRGD